MNRNRLNEVADMIDIPFEGISDEMLIENIKSEIKSMFISLEEHSLYGKSYTHPELNQFDKKGVWNCVNFLFDLRIEFDLLKETNQNTQIVIAQLEMQEIWDAFFSIDFELQSREFQERFLCRLEEFSKSLNIIESKSYDLNKMKFECMTIESMIMVSHNVEDTGMSGLEGLFEDEEKKVS